MTSLPQVKYAGKIKEIRLGKPGHEITVGGESAYNFYLFEGAMPNPPRLALQILDIEPEEWAEEALEPYKDVVADPVAWALKCQNDYGADLVCLWLAGADPNGKDLPAERCAEIAKKVAEAIQTPLIVWGVSSDEKNTQVLKAVAESCAGLNVVLGPVTDGNYKQVGAAAIAYKHAVAASTPIDINLAKQLNILLENLGVPPDRLLIDPTTGAVGYGLEYCYSVMERIRQAALTQNDDKLQYPIINNIAEEVWKTKEAKLNLDEAPQLGNPAMRGVNLEIVTAVSALQAGSDILILRHPKTLSHLRKYIEEMTAKTDLSSMAIDLSLVAAPPPKEEAPKAESQSLEPRASVPPPQSPSAQAKAADQPVSPKEEVSPPSLSVPETSVEAAEEPAPVPSAQPCAKILDEAAGAEKPETAAAQSDAASLTDEDIQGLREMLAAFRAIKNLFAAIGKLAGGA